MRTPTFMLDLKVEQEMDKLGRCGAGSWSKDCKNFRLLNPQGIKGLARGSEKGTMARWE